MSLRVRKLARELETSPDDVLRLLREMGYDRYRSPDDLVADDVVARVRRAGARSAGSRARPLSRTPSARSSPPEPFGLPAQPASLLGRERASSAPLPGPPPAKAAPQAAAGGGALALEEPELPAEGEDWMARLVPGVLRAGESAARRAPSARASTAPRASRAPSDRSMPPPSAGASAVPGATSRSRPPTGFAEERAESAREALAAERRRLEAARDELAAARAALEAERAGLAADREALAADRAAHEASVTARQEDLRQRSLLGLLEERGLSGLDECERAIAALASGRVLGRLLGVLVPTDPDAVRRVLNDRLVLVAGPVAEDLGPTVQVAPARADVRGGVELERQISRLGAALLLEGHRRVVVAGVPPRLQALMTGGMDPRVELTFRPGGQRDEAQAAQDVARGDLVVTWNVEVTPAARAVYADARKRLVELRGRTMSEFLDGWYASHRTV